MPRYALYVRFVMVLVVLTTLAMLLGNEPWGPN
jgi:hypothetical protein